MTHEELVYQLAKQADLYLYQSRAALEALADIIDTEVTAGGEVRIRNLGIFEEHEYAAKMGRNWRTKQPMVIPAWRELIFRPAGRLKRLKQKEE